LALLADVGGLRDVHLEGTHITAAGVAAVRSSLPLCRFHGYVPAADAAWLGQQLAAGKPLRINCGGGDCIDSQGRRWSRDRWFVLGKPVQKRAEINGDEQSTQNLYRTARSFGYGRTRPPRPYALLAYRIPLPPGKYRVTLQFPTQNPQPKASSFDVFVQRQAIASTFQSENTVSHVARRTFDVGQTERSLDISCKIYKSDVSIAAIQIERLAALSAISVGNEKSPYFSVPSQ
jgi:hypothetical protein